MVCVAESLKSLRLSTPHVHQDESRTEQYQV